MEPMPGKRAAYPLHVEDGEDERHNDTAAPYDPHHDLVEDVQGQG